MCRIPPIDPRDAVLSVAEAMTWVRELGANRGQSVEAILRRVHLQPGSPWCAAFVAWCGYAALRYKWPLPLVGGCATLAEAAEARGMLREQPEVGAVFLIWGESVNRFRHTGFITLSGQSMGSYTVEGNTSPDGSPDGTGVFARLRSFGPRDRFIHWWI